MLVIKELFPLSFEVIQLLHRTICSHKSACDKFPFGFSFVSTPFARNEYRNEYFAHIKATAVQTDVRLFHS